MSKYKVLKLFMRKAKQLYAGERDYVMTQALVRRFAALLDELRLWKWAFPIYGKPRICEVIMTFQAFSEQFLKASPLLWAGLMEPSQKPGRFPPAALSKAVLSGVKVRSSLFLSSHYGSKNYIPGKCLFCLFVSMLVRTIFKLVFLLFL